MIVFCRAWVVRVPFTPAVDGLAYEPPSYVPVHSLSTVHPEPYPSYGHRIKAKRTTVLSKEMQCDSSIPSLNVYHQMQVQSRMSPPIQI